MADPTVIANIKKAAAQAGADPVAMLATSLVEDGARPGVVGDQGTSFGPFQFHVGGALGNHPASWADTPAAYLNRAQEFARLQVHGGKGAAAVQRPANPAGYAQRVQGELGQARQLLGSTAPAAPLAGSQPKATAPITVGSTPGIQTSDAADIGNPILQSILDSNAKLAGINSITLPVATPIAPRATPAPVKVDPAAIGTGGLDKTGQNIVNVARKYLGTAYQWGGASPKTGFDCSGLLQWAAAQSGLKIPRTSEQQFKAGKPVPTSQLRPGDAVFFEPKADGPGHVGIYVGGGKYIESPHTGDVVKIATLNTRSDFVGARRFT